MNGQPTPALPDAIRPSPAMLAKATGGAIVAAAAILTLFVLPAEYGVDPTGIGSALGLKGMVAGGAKDAASIQTPTVSTDGATPTKASIIRSTPWRQDEMTITLPPHSGQEIKAHMKKGDSFVFAWTSTGPIKAEMHGEVLNAADDAFTDYWKDLAIAGGQGDFTAPFAGIHGWYFRNKSDTPVTVTVKTVGFYQDLFQPKGE